MKNNYFIFLLLFITISVNSQEKYITKTGFASFFSHSLVEDIKAENNQVLSIVDTKTGKIAVQMLMRSFIFRKALMQEHFNESYIESYKFPKATFTGIIKNYQEIPLENTETVVEGKLTIRGITKLITVKINVEIRDKELRLKGNFRVKVKDFDIKIPAIVSKNIAKTIKVSFKLTLFPK